VPGSSRRCILASMTPAGELRVPVIDSHTGGEPTRVVIGGGPDLGNGSLADRRAVFRERFDWFRSAVVNEPRGSDVLVGALLTEPNEPGCSAGVIFFNNVGCLGMCGHGTIGVAVTLARLGRIGPGAHKLDTPVGVVGFDPWLLTAMRRRWMTIRSTRPVRHTRLSSPVLARARATITPTARC